MKIPNKCKGCMNYSNNTFFSNWFQAFIFSHKCQKEFAISPWVREFFTLMNTKDDKDDHDPYSAPSTIKGVFEIFVVGTLIMLLMLPLLVLSITQGRITKKVLFVCAVKRAYKPIYSAKENK